MKHIIYTLFLFVLFFSCEKYPEPGNETLEYFYVRIIGDYQTTEGGEYLPQEIGCKIDFEYIIPQLNTQFRMEIEITSGDGSVDNSIVMADNEGQMLTRWKLGNNRNAQVLTCSVFDADDKLYAEFKIEATAYFPDQENYITSGYLCGIQDMVVDTVNHRSMLSSSNGIYSKTDKFYNWEQLNNFYWTNVKELEINSKNEIYAAGWNGELYKTSDWGRTWSSLGKPIPGNPYHYELTITNDDYIWANKWECGIYCSKDGGYTWQKDTVGVTSQEEFGRIFSLADTAHMAVSYYNLTIHKTTDDGLTWTPINTPEYSVSMFVTNDNSMIVQNQESTGFTLHKSSDGGETYKKVFSPYVAFGTSSKHCYLNFGNDYYVLAPGGGIWKTKDFEDFEEIATFNQQRNLFIDHSGTIYASGFSSEPTLVIPSESEQ